MVIREEIFQLNDLTLSEKMILSYMCVKYEREYYALEQLSKIFKLTRQSITHIMSNLEKKGYILRSIPRGKRYYIYTLTAKTFKAIGVLIDYDFQEEFKKALYRRSKYRKENNITS